MQKATRNFNCDEFDGHYGVTHHFYYIEVMVILDLQTIIVEYVCKNATNVKKN